MTNPTLSPPAALQDCDRHLAVLKATAGRDHRTRESVRLLEVAFSTLREVQMIQHKFYEQKQQAVDNDYKKKQQIADKEMKAALAGTPPNRWSTEGHEPDPFLDYYNRERKDLALGSFTDDELANAVFMYGNDYGGRLPMPEDIISGKKHMPGAYLTAAKERIRWLSRKVISLTDQLKGLQDKPQCKSGGNCCWHDPKMPAFTDPL